MMRFVRRLLDGARSRSAPSAVRPQLEPLEDRFLLAASVFDVSDLAAGGQRTGSERAVARAEDGTFAVVWDGPGTEGLYLRVYDADGNAASAAQAIAGTNNLSSQVTIGVNGSGSQFVVAWAHNGDIRAQRFAKDGSKVGGVIDVAATSAGEFSPAVAVDDWGNFTVAYASQTGTDSDVLVRRFDKNGTALGAALAVGATSAPESDPAIAVSPAGFTVVTWTTLTSSGNRDVHAQRIDYRGNLVGGRLAVANSAADESQSSVTVDRNGGFVVAYTSSSGSQGDILARRYTSTAALRTTLVVANSATSDEFAPSIAGTRDGAFTVAWTASQGSGNTIDRNVMLRSYDASGVALGAASAVADTTTRDEQTPAVAVNSAGAPVIVFEDLDAKGGAGGVYVGMPGGSSFSVGDASLDDSAGTAFRDGALRVSYEFNPAGSTVTRVVVEATKGNTTYTLGTFTAAGAADALLNLAAVSGLSDGTYQVRAVATLANGKTITSAAQDLRILAGTTAKGNYTADTLNYGSASGNGAVFLGSGGTDVLNLGIARALVASINGLTLAQFNPATNSTNGQAIYKGSAYDYLRLTDGREVYFQGFERLKFADNTFLELVTKPNDPMFASQWNLQVSDVAGAWRFTQGSAGVLLVSLDTGILTAAGATGGVNDISTSRLLTDSTDDDNYNNYGHGHSSISIMAASANNAGGIAGINNKSSVYVVDVYNGASLQQGIKDALSYAQQRGLKVVFEGGIQGEYWLNSGGTQAQLEKLLSDNEATALFEFAAGNGGVDLGATSGVDPTYSGGVARLAATHGNVVSVGALQRSSTTTANGLSNAGGVTLASYSNRGAALTLVASTDVPVVDKYNQNAIFYGTSAANPNVAAIASLVWSANGNLTGTQVRQILTDTAIDLGAAGRDNTYGAGLIDADAAVRRAVALGRAADLAGLYTASGGSASGGTSAPGGSGGSTAPPSMAAAVDAVFTAEAASTVAAASPATAEVAPAYWVGAAGPTAESPAPVEQTRQDRESGSTQQAQAIFAAPAPAASGEVVLGRVVHAVAGDLFLDLDRVETMARMNTSL